MSKWLEEYLLYSRKSRSDNPNESVEEVLAKHERDLQEHAVKLFGKPIPEENIYREVVSGETIQDRPEVQKLLALIEDPKIKGVFVIEPQRLSRGDWEDGGKILSSFKYSNTLIITPTKTYNLHDKFDYKFFKMELAQGNEYLEYFKEIQERGRVRSVKEGNYIGGIAPYGFKKVMIDKCPTLEEYKPESNVINLALNMYVNEDLGWAKICHRLEELGHMPRKVDHWIPNVMRDICLNPHNIGMVKWKNRKVVKVYEDGKLKKTRPRNKDDIIYVRGKHSPIVDVELYNKAVEKYGRNTKEPKYKTLENPLAGLLYCKNCGRAMMRRVYKKNGTDISSRRFVCLNQYHCKTKSSNYDDVYNSVIKILENAVEDFEMKIKNNNDDSLFDIQSKVLEELENKLDKLEVKQNELYEFLEEGIYTKDVFLNRNKKLADEREHLKHQISETKKNLPKKVNYRDLIVKFTEVIETLKDDGVSAKHKNTLLKTVVERIEYDRDSSKRHKYDDSKPIIEVQLKEF